MGNQMSNVIGVVVLFFLLIVLFLAFNEPLSDIYDNIRTLANETDGLNYTNVNDQLSKYPMIFGFFCVCFGIAIIVSYAVNSHRREYEEYPYEPPY